MRVGCFTCGFYQYQNHKCLCCYKTRKGREIDIITPAWCPRKYEEVEVKKN